MNLELDDEAVKMIEEYQTYWADESFGLHLAAKITELYEEQYGQRR